MLAFILIVGVLIAIYFIVNSQKRKKEEEQRRLENERIAREQQEQEAKRLEAERIAKEKKEFAEAKHKEYADVLSELYDMGKMKIHLSQRMNRRIKNLFLVGKVQCNRRKQCKFGVRNTKNLLQRSTMI